MLLKTFVRGVTSWFLFQNTTLMLTEVK